jgi:hypothetical protein
MLAFVGSNKNEATPTWLDIPAILRAVVSNNPAQSKVVTLALEEFLPTKMFAVESSAEP